MHFEHNAESILLKGKNTSFKALLASATIWIKYHDEEATDDSVKKKKVWWERESWHITVLNIHYWINFHQTCKTALPDHIKGLDNQHKLNSWWKRVVFLQTIQKQVIPKSLGMFFNFSLFCLQPQNSLFVSHANPNQV